MKDFYTIITKNGLQNLAESKINGQNVRLTHLAVGDSLGGYYEPKPEQTSLYKELYRGVLNRIYTDPDYPTQIILEAAIPSEIGGFFVREVGVLDEAGNLFAVGKYPATYKPASDSGAGKDLYIRMTLAFASTPNISLFINPNNAVVTADRLADYAKVDLSNVPTENKSHQQWGDLQGGNEEERYHLTQNQHQLTNDLRQIVRLENKYKGFLINSDGTSIIDISPKEICQDLTVVEGDELLITPLCSIYEIPMPEDKELFINPVNVQDFGSIITIELLIKMPAIKKFSIQNQVVWLNDEPPEYDEAGNYLIALRTFDNGATWVGCLQGKWHEI